MWCAWGYAFSPVANSSRIKTRTGTMTTGILTLRHSGQLDVRKEQRLQLPCRGRRTRMVRCFLPLFSLILSLCRCTVGFVALLLCKGAHLSIGAMLEPAERRRVVNPACMIRQWLRRRDFANHAALTDNVWVGNSRVMNHFRAQGPWPRTTTALSSRSCNSRLRTRSRSGRDRTEMATDLFFSLEAAENESNPSEGERNECVSRGAYGYCVSTLSGAGGLWHCSRGHNTL